MAFFVNAFFMPKCPIIRGFGRFIPLQNLRISGFRPVVQEYARNDDFSKNRGEEILSSHLLRFRISNIGY